MKTLPRLAVKIKTANMGKRSKKLTKRPKWANTDILSKSSIREFQKDFRSNFVDFMRGLYDLHDNLGKFRMDLYLDDIQDISTL